MNMAAKDSSALEPELDAMVLKEMTSDDLEESKRYGLYLAPGREGFYTIYPEPIEIFPLLTQHRSSHSPRRPLNFL